VLFLLTCRLSLVSVCLYVCCITFAESEPYCHSILFVCLPGCLSVIPRPTAYHDWSITTKFGRQVTCPQTCVSLFGSPISHTFGARGKNMQNFAYCIFLPLRTWRIVPYDLSVCLSVWKVYCGKMSDWIHIPFGVVSGVGQGMGVLDGVVIVKREGAVLGWIWGISL